MLTIIVALAIYLLFGVWALLVGRVLTESADAWWMRNLIPIAAWVFWPLIVMAGIVVLVYIIANK